MRLAICDNNLEFINQIEDIVVRTYQELQLEIQTLRFQSGVLLLEEIQKGENEMDLILLDIDICFLL